MLKVDTIGFSYDARQPTLSDISFELQPGEHLSVMGASGSGKSTLLRLLFGSLTPDSGSVSWRGRALFGRRKPLIPGHPGFSYVSQSFDLNPYMRVAEYLRTNLDPHRITSETDRIADLLGRVQLQGVQEAEIRHLSMGQQQRVALVKALLAEPEVLLLDEPFTHVDAYQKNYLRLSLFPYLRDRGIAVVNATHDGQDVLPFADSLLVLKQGVIHASGHVREVYDRPRTHYVAALLGLVNQIRGNEFGLSEASGHALIYAEEVYIGIMPEGHGNYISAQAEVCRSFFQGSRQLLELRTSSGSQFYAYSEVAFSKGQALFVSVSEALYLRRRLS